MLPHVENPRPESSVGGSPLRHKRTFLVKPVHPGILGCENPRVATEPTSVSKADRSKYDITEDHIAHSTEQGCWKWVQMTLEEGAMARVSS